MACKFSIGERFASFEILAEKISIFKKENSVELCVKDSRKISLATTSQRLSKDRTINPALKYSEIRYECVESGKYLGRGKGKRNSRYVLYIFSFKFR